MYDAHFAFGQDRNLIVGGPYNVCPDGGYIEQADGLK